MAVATRRDKFIELDVPQREVNLIKQVPGARYNARSQRWRTALSWAAAKQLRGVFGEKLEADDALAEWSWEEFEYRVDPVTNARAAALDPALDTLGDRRLYPFQRTSVEFLKKAGSAILADDLGTGKTVQSLVAVQHWPLLVVTTKSCKGQWAKEIETWCSGVEPFVLDGSVAQRRKTLAAFEEAHRASEVAPEYAHPVALVVNWDQLVAHSRLAPYGSIALSDKDKEPKELNAISWGTVIADEAHKAKDPKTRWTRALWALGDVARSRYALTGTPLEGSLLDFWTLLRFVAPEEWPTRSGFVDRYCTKTYNFFGGLEVDRLRADTEDEFREIMEPRFLRRPKDLVAPWLPPKVPVVRRVELSPKQKKAYNALEKEFVAALDEGEVVAFTDLTREARLLQLTAAMLEEREDGTYALIEPSPKLDELEELLAELGDQPVAVFSASRQLLALAQRRLEKAETPYGLIAGDIPLAARDIAREDFNDGRVRVLLVSLGAGAEGLNLTRGQYEVFLDRSWSFLTNRQAEDRMHGIGRGDKDAEAITVIDILACGTLDEGRHKLYSKKGELMEHLVKDKEVIRRMLRGEIE